jgi:hypothetical protein
MSFQPFPTTKSCLHQMGGNYVIHTTPSIDEAPQIQWPSPTRFDLIEGWYTPLTLEGDNILVHRESISTKKDKPVWVDYLSEKVSCPQAQEGSPCWMRHAYVYCPTEQRSKLYQINGTTITF